MDEIKNKEVLIKKPLPFAFHPKATNVDVIGRSSDLFRFNRLPIRRLANSG